MRLTDTELTMASIAIQAQAKNASPSNARLLTKLAGKMLDELERREANYSRLHKRLRLYEGPRKYRPGVSA